MMEPNIAPDVRWGEWITEGWQMFALRWKVWVLQTLIIFSVFAIPFVFIYGWAISAAIVEERTGQQQDPPPMFVALVLMAVPLIILASIYFFGGLWCTATKQLRGEEVSVRDIFSGGDHFLPLLGAVIPLGILYFIGAMLCFFPAFIVQGLFHFTIPLIIDRRLSVGSAISASFNATKGHWLMFSLFALVVYLVSSSGIILCYIGYLVTFPLQITIMAIAYRDTFGVRGALSFGPASTRTTTSYAGQSWPVPPQPASPASGAPSAPPSPRPLFSQSVEPQQQPALHCSQCGAAIARVAKFCNICGSPLQS
jgi:membrane-anchored glycerophosphoryl diester phosphodiesterase (GDPDase)